MKRRQRQNETLDQLLDQTSELVVRLVSDYQTLKAENAKLTQEVGRLSRGWDEIRRLTRGGPRRRRRPGAARPGPAR